VSGAAALGRSCGARSAAAAVDPCVLEVSTGGAEGVWGPGPLAPRGERSGAPRGLSTRLGAGRVARAAPFPGAGRSASTVPAAPLEGDARRRARGSTISHSQVPESSAPFEDGEPFGGACVNPFSCAPSREAARFARPRPASARASARLGGDALGESGIRLWATKAWFERLATAFTPDAGPGAGGFGTPPREKGGSLALPP
jgi:hypothetical protein